jgi:hypothetical protein
VGVIHDFLAKFGVGLQSFIAVSIARGVPNNLSWARDELSLVWAVFFDANNEVFSLCIHKKKINLNLILAYNGYARFLIHYVFYIRDAKQDHPLEKV